MKTTSITFALCGLLLAGLVSTQDQDTSSVISVQDNDNVKSNDVIQKSDINTQNDNSGSGSPAIGGASGGDDSNVASGTITGDNIADSGVNNEEFA